MSANIIDQRTANLGLPLPNVNNMQDQDCGRIAESLRMLDAAHGKVRTDLASVRVEVGEDLAAVTEQSANAARDADTAIGKANDAASVAQSAATAAASALEAAQNAKGAALYADVPIDQVPADVLAGMAVGQFITAPEPVASGGSAGDVNLSAYPTREEMKAYAPQKLTSNLLIYIDPAHANASDILDEDRGLIRDKPFVSLQAALKWGTSNYVGPYILRFIICSDITLSSPLQIHSIHIDRILIEAENENVKINMDEHGCIYLYSGALQLYNCKLVGASGHLPEFVYSTSQWGVGASIIINNVNFSGTTTLSVLKADWGGKILVLNDVTGDVVGKKYSATNGGCILTGGKLDQLPGTIAGTCDESSTVA